MATHKTPRLGSRARQRLCPGLVLLLRAPGGELLLQSLPHAFIHFLELCQGVCKGRAQTEERPSVRSDGTRWPHRPSRERACFSHRAPLEKGGVGSASEKQIREATREGCNASADCAWHTAPSHRRRLSHAPWVRPHTRGQRNTAASHPTHRPGRSVSRHGPCHTRFTASVFQTQRLRQRDGPVHR